MPVAGLGAVGFIVGAIIGILTRPTILGVPVPLGVLVSPYPMDAPFRAQLWQHLGLAGVAGAIVFAAAGYFWNRRNEQVSPSSRPAVRTPQLPAKDYDVARWHALVEYDPDLKAAVARLAVYGPKYTEKLAIDFLRLNDKSYLATMVADVETLARSDLASGRNPVGYDVAKWKYYTDYDPDIQEAVKLLQTYGSGYVDMLAQAFLASNNDKRLLGNMVAKIEAEARANIELNGERPTKSGKYLGYSWWEYPDGVVVSAFADGDRTFSSMQEFMTAATTAARSTNG